MTEHDDTHEGGQGTARDRNMTSKGSARDSDARRERTAGRERAAAGDRAATRLRALMRAVPPAPRQGQPPGVLESQERRRRRAALVVGGVLIAAGALTFVLLLGGVSSVSLAIFVPGVLLVALALGWRPVYALYLAGLGLAGWGAGAIVDRAIASPMFLSAVGLGCGLCFAWLVRRVQAGRAHLWPLLFGVFFAGIGVLAGFDHPREVAWHAWPLLLVAAGVAFVLRAVLPQRRGVGRPPRL
jgi:hypothetical protein